MSELNLHIGDCIHYGGHGVCRICGRETKSFGHTSRDYYLLQPVGDSKTTLYLPVDAQPERVRLRHVLTAREIFHLVEQEQENPPVGSVTAASGARSVGRPSAAVMPVP